MKVDSGQTELAGLDHEPNRSPILVVDCHVDERGKANYVDPRLSEVVARNGDGLYCLVGGAGAYRLHFRASTFTDHTGNRPGHCTRSRPGRDFENFAASSDLAVAALRHNRDAFHSRLARG